jgi:murein DD-endopeptidase MepM/ murein hydrolase activator NlpD
MAPKRKRNTSPRGYGNIFTPHAGSMIVQVQREGGLANRTIVLTERQVRLLRLVTSRAGRIGIAVLLASWVFFALQAARVPLLSRQITHMKRDAVRLDTLQVTLAELQKRYEQVTTMLGVTPAPAAAGADSALAGAARGASASRDSAQATPPTRWPLEGRGFVTRGVGTETRYDAAHPGLDIATAMNTPVRAAGGGSVVEVGQSAEYGNFLRIAHSDGYETLYGHTNRILVHSGDRVAQGQVIALSGNTGRSTAPHLHFEVRHGGKVIDPMQIITKEQQD